MLDILGPPPIILLAAFPLQRSKQIARHGVGAVVVGLGEWSKVCLFSSLYFQCEMGKEGSDDVGVAVTIEVDEEQQHHVLMVVGSAATPTTTAAAATTVTAATPTTVDAATATVTTAIDYTTDHNNPYG